MTATYGYYEFKLVVEGDIIVSDETGQRIKAVKGDILYFPKGATSEFVLDNDKGTTKNLCLLNAKSPSNQRTAVQLST
jgi:uncharacterized cupin superfamily protein